MYKMNLIIWLWNIGKKYNNTRHNVWFMAVEKIQTEFWGDKFKTELKFKADISSCNINWEKTILVKPNTFMNLSGESLSLIQKFYKIKNVNILIIYDDKDMEFWKLRTRETWSAWGHNGIKSIIQHLWTQDFKRIKIWVWDKNNPAYQDASNFVLWKFSKDEMEELKYEILNKVVELIRD